MSMINNYISINAPILIFYLLIVYINNNLLRISEL